MVPLLGVYMLKATLIVFTPKSTASLGQKFKLQTLAIQGTLATKHLPPICCNKSQRLEIQELSLKLWL